MRAIFFAVLFVMIGFVSQKASAAPTAEEAKLQEQLEIQRAYGAIVGIKSVVSTLANLSLACEEPSDCTAIAMGSRACGGPTSYVVTSKANTSIEALNLSIQLETKAESELNQKFHIISICSVEMPPELDCKSKVCSTLR